MRHGDTTAAGQDCIEALEAENAELERVYHTLIGSPEAAEWMTANSFECVHDIMEHVATLRARNAELVEGLEAAARRFRNIRGAVESGQVVDKDVHGSALHGHDEARAIARAADHAKQEETDNGR